MTRIEQKKAFIKELAKFLVDNQAGKSIFLQLETERPSVLNGVPKWAHEWAQLRSAVPTIFGYPTVEEAERKIEEFLG